jgi:signal transduction histidine kinase
MASANTSPGNSVQSARYDDQVHAAALVTMLRLHWFVRLRWVFLAAAIAVLVLERLIVSDARRPAGLFVVLASLGCVNLIWTAFSYVLFRRFRESTPRGRVEIFANAQVAVDLLLLTCILRFTGGSANPMAIFYLFHMAIVSLLLTRWEAILQGLWALLLYAGLVIGEQRGWLVPAYGLLPNHPIPPSGGPAVGFASLLVLACGIGGMLYFTLQIAARLQQGERELRRANQALRQSQTAIEDLQRRRSRFMQTAAHQLKSPLAVIQTLAELIRSNVVPPEAISKTCDRIVHRCADGLVQVGELITLARVQEADPARHGRSEADVRRVITTLCERFEPIAREKKLDFQYELPEAGDLHVCVDERDLADCVGNLIDNAIKYTPGPGRVSVTARIEFTPGRPVGVGISVTDTGIGLPPELLRATADAPGETPAFDAFRRGNNALAAGIPGTGLGLSIVREIVEQTGGRIRVTSDIKKGSSFTVVFPMHYQDVGQPLVRSTRASDITVGP